MVLGQRNLCWKYILFFYLLSLRLKVSANSDSNDSYYYLYTVTGLLCDKTLVWFCKEQLKKNKNKMMNLSKIGNNSVKWGAGFARTPHPHIHKHTLSHTHTHCCTTRDTVAAFSKGKDKYNTVSGSSAVRYANTQEQQQNEIHTPTSV